LVRWGVGVGVECLLRELVGTRLVETRMCCTKAAKRFIVLLTNAAYLRHPPTHTHMHAQTYLLDLLSLVLTSRPFSPSTPRQRVAGLVGALAASELQVRACVRSDWLGLWVAWSTQCSSSRSSSTHPRHTHTYICNTGRTAHSSRTQHAWLV